MNRMLKILATALLCATAVFAEDDEEDEAEAGPDMRPLVYIDAKAIENKTDNQKANFKGLIDRLNNALTECGIYRVINSTDISTGVADDDTFKVVADDGGKESKIETPAFKIYMTVMQYGFAAAGGTDMYGNTSQAQQAKIELILRVVNMRTKETVKSKNISRSASGSATAAANLAEQVLQEANKKVTNDIVNELVKITPFSVLDTEDGEILVDAPSNRVKVGQQLLVYRKGRKIKNPRTGKLMARERQVAVISVTTLSEDCVTCKLVSGEAKENDIVRIPDIPPAAAAAPAAAAPVPAGAAPF